MPLTLRTHTFLKRMLKEDFEKLEPKDLRGLPLYFTVLDDGQIKIWPALDTAQVIISCDVT